MKPITFVKTRHPYDSYSDFWKLVELSGFPAVYVDQIDLTQDVSYILSPMNGEYMPHIDNQHRLLEETGLSQEAELILWNLERPSEGLQAYIDRHVSLLEGYYFDRIIVSDRQLAKETGFDYIPLGSHPDLGAPGRFAEKAFDVIHLSCYSPHRSWLFNDPNNPKEWLNENVRVAGNGWGASRNNHLQRSKFMLNTHQDGLGYIEPLRFSIAAAYGLPIISEISYDFYPYEDFIVPLLLADGKLSGAIMWYIKEYDEGAYATGLALRRFMTLDYSFRNCIERSL